MIIMGTEAYNRCENTLARDYRFFASLRKQNGQESVANEETRSSKLAVSRFRGVEYNGR